MLDDNADFKVINDAVPFFGVNLRRVWDSSELVGYVSEILHDAQSNAFKALPDEVLAAFHRLLELHRQDYPQQYPDLDASQDFHVIHDAFPHIAEKIKVLWGQKELVTYMDEFFKVSRGVGRKGFPGDVLMALSAIGAQHQEIFGHLYPKPTLWEIE